MKKILSLGIVSLFLSTISYAEPIRSTAEDQKAVAVTVYNNGLGLVKDVRGISVSKGQGELNFMDVASGIQPVTVSVRALKDPTSFRVLEQNYEYDLMDASKILDKYVGKTVKIENWNQFQDRKDIVEATLLSNEGQIYRVKDEIYLGYPGTKIVPEIPNNLISKPTLAWLYESSASGPTDLEVSYLTSGISWNADYVLLVDALDQNADLSGWVTIDNHSGATFKDAGLKVVAGNLNAAPVPYAARGVEKSAMLAAAAPSFAEQAFFEYHLYDLQRKTTIKNNETKQINLLEASGLKIQKEYLVQGQQYWYFQQYNGADLKRPVEVYVQLMNTKANRLGIPLPQGTIRLYKKDRQGSEQFIGSDQIKHTPVDEKVRVKVGEAFDIICERKQTDYKQLTSRSNESGWQILLKNHKDEDVVVSLIEPMSGDSKVISSSHPAKKESAFLIRFDVPVPKKSETTVTYRVNTVY